MSESLLRLPDVKARVGLSRSQIYALMRAHDFPEPVALGARAIAWPSSWIDEWIADRIKGGRQTTTEVSK